MSWYPGKFTRGTPVIPYGPGTPYATVNDLPDWVADSKLSVLDKSTGIVSACCWVFHNEGTDYADLGRPSYLDNLRPGVDFFSVRCVASRSIEVESTLVSWGTPLAQASKQFQLLCTSNSSTAMYSGGVKTILNHESTALNTYHAYDASVNAANVSLSMDGATTSGISGTTISSEKFFIGGRTDGVSNNFEGDTAFVSIKNGSGVIIDVIDFGDITQWTGGSSGVTKAGKPFTFTDGAPTGIRKKAAIPRNLLVY